MTEKVLEEKDLEEAAGGVSETITYMACTDCFYVGSWYGDYLNMGPYKCNGCFKNTMYGVEHCNGKMIKDFEPLHQKARELAAKNK